MSLKNPIGEERFATAHDLSMDDLLTVEEVSRWLKVPRNWVYDAPDEGETTGFPFSSSANTSASNPKRYGRSWRASGSLRDSDASLR
jgi:hypothetical protein